MENIFTSFQSLADSVAANNKYPSWNVTVSQAHDIASDARTKTVSGFVHGTRNIYVAVEITVTRTTVGHPIVVSN